jgi:N-acetylglucosaminyldiphosphoundecaprenol N-acetyl-beta-D-mannosaminyltransferase
VAGSVRRAPAWMQRIGVEWLWRINEEPTLWRRYWTDGWVFLRLLVLRVLPLAWILRRRRPSKRELKAATVQMQRTANGPVVAIEGAWTEANLQLLRDAFAHVALKEQHLQLDLAGVTHADPAFLGLLVALYRHQHSVQRRFICLRVSAPLQRILRLSCMDYVLQPSLAPAPSSHPLHP